VGSRTVTVSGLVTEVWYPAVPGSEAGKSKDWIDTREYMPESDPVATDPKFQIDSYDSLPIDTAYGPYPVIIYVHGTGSFRTASHALFTHWASRGFVVLCADNPGIMLGDLLEGGCGALLSADQEGDTRKLISAVGNPSGSLAFLAGRLTTNRIGLGGHSAGGAAIAGLGSALGVRVIVPMASGGVESGTAVESALIMGGLKDEAATPNIVRSGYEDTPIKKRLVLIPNAGHMAFCSVCPIIMESDEELGSLATIANDGCGPQYMAPALSTEIANFASTAVFEETLVCSSTAAAQISTIANRYSGVEYEYDANSSSSSSGGCN
jgi:dienelactone hydrolase